MNKGELKAVVLDTLVRQDLAGKPVVDSWVAAATARLNQDLLLNAQVARVTRTLDNRFIDLPANFLSVKSLRITSGAFGDESRSLEYQPPEEIASMSGRAMRGQICQNPKYYTTFNQRLEIAPWVAGATINIELWYYRTFPDLVTDEDTNFILLQSPQLYINLTCSIGHQYLLETDAAMSREAMAMAEIQRLMARKDAEKYGDGPLIVRPSRRIGGRFS